MTERPTSQRARDSGAPSARRTWLESGRRARRRQDPACGEPVTDARAGSLARRWGPRRAARLARPRLGNCRPHHVTLRSGGPRPLPLPGGALPVRTSEPRTAGAPCAEPPAYPPAERPAPTRIPRRQRRSAHAPRHSRRSSPPFPTSAFPWRAKGEVAARAPGCRPVAHARAAGGHRTESGQTTSAS